jgi:hypothetical protein
MLCVCVHFLPDPLWCFQAQMSADGTLAELLCAFGGSGRAAARVATAPDWTRSVAATACRDSDCDRGLRLDSQHHDDAELWRWKHATAVLGHVSAAFHVHGAGSSGGGPGGGPGQGGGDDGSGSGSDCDPPSGGHQHHPGTDVGIAGNAADPASCVNPPSGPSRAGDPGAGPGAQCMGCALGWPVTALPYRTAFRCGVALRADIMARVGAAGLVEVLARRYHNAGPKIMLQCAHVARPDNETLVRELLESFG